ncbi:MAG: hypothetical protein M0R73_01765 [Dehalococcoidia bacterium]|nr:hypothetical protein [Dehalococcoidia bacterium]
MFDPEIAVRFALGGLLVGGFIMFLTAPESRRPDVPTSVRGLDGEDATRS